MVEASALKSSRELMHCLLEEVNIDFRRSKHEESVRMSIHTLQVGSRQEGDAWL